MRSLFLRALPALFAALALAACATTGAPPVAVVHHSQAVSHSTPPIESGFAALPGWADDDHAAALAAFRAGCPAAKDLDLAIVCRRALAQGRLDEAGARRFLEANFRPEPVAEEGLLTAYFAPVYDARTTPDAEFSAPVRPRPADLPPEGSRLQTPYPDRAAIDTRAPDGALAWMRPEDLFFLQIQGSGVLVFDDGSRMKALYAGTNGARFVGIATPMREQGLLVNTAGESIRAWLAAHRGDEAEAVMRLNPRYVFFRLAPDDGKDPPGAAGAPLIPGRSVAVDLSRHALGDLVWIDATAPTLIDAFPAYRRLAIALDTGGAIKGEARADLYLGSGPAAGLEAGRVRHRLRLYRLAPLVTPNS